MTANTKQTLTTITDRSVIAVTCGRPVTSGVTNKPPPNSPHSALSVARTAFASQSMTPSISQPTSGAEDVLEDGQDDRGEQGQAVADAGRLQRAFGPLHLGGVTAGHQVAGAAGAPAVTSTVMAAAVATARRMRLRYMGGSHLPPQQWGTLRKRIGGVTAGGGVRGRGSRAPSQAE